MNSWKEVRIAELCKSGLAELQTGPFGSQLHAHDYVERGIPVVPTEAIRNRQIDPSVLPQISEEKAQHLSRHRLRVGDILFARRGVQATGHIGVVREAEQGFICGTGAIRLRLQPDNRTIDPDFLSHVLANPASIAWFKFNAIGATMPNLNEGIIERFSFALPPYERQLAIASLLNNLDDKIALIGRMNITLETIAKAIFKDWFIDFGPTRAKIEGKAPYLAPEIWSLFPDDLDAGGVPVGWVRSAIGECYDVVGGSTPSTQQPEYWDGGLAWVTPKDLSALNSPILLKTERTITEAGLAKISSGLLPVGTVLLSSRAPIGYVAISHIPVAINQGFIALVPNGKFPSEFGVLWIKENMEVIKQNANGSTFLEISKSNFRPLQVVTGSSEVMESFSSLVSPMFEKIAANERESGNLGRLRDFLLPKLMSGEIRLKDAEQAVEAVV